MYLIISISYTPEAVKAFFLTFSCRWYIIHTMKRVNYHLTDPQIKGLKALSKKTDTTVAEHVRRAVDRYLASINAGREAKY